MVLEEFFSIINILSCVRAMAMLWRSMKILERRDTYNGAKRTRTINYIQSLNQNLCGTTLLPFGRGGAEDKNLIVLAFFF